MRILAICGSLRAASSNLTLLHDAVAAAPPGVSVEIYDGLASLPPFNPDLDFEGAVAPPPVAELRARVAAAAAVIISSPEYAHGVPGVLKNALDWIVSSGEFTDKPTALLNARPGSGAFAHASLRETLSIMGARVVEPSPTLAATLRALL